MLQFPGGNPDFAPLELYSGGKFLASLKSTVKLLLPSARKDFNLLFQLVFSLAHWAVSKGNSQVIAKHNILVKSDKI